MLYTRGENPRHSDISSAMLMVDRQEPRETTTNGKLSAMKDGGTTIWSPTLRSLRRLKVILRRSSEGRLVGENPPVSISHR